MHNINTGLLFSVCPVFVFLGGWMLKSLPNGRLEGSWAERVGKARGIGTQLTALQCRIPILSCSLWFSSPLLSSPALAPKELCLNWIRAFCFTGSLSIIWKDTDTCSWLALIQRLILALFIKEEEYLRSLFLSYSCYFMISKMGHLVTAATVSGKRKSSGSDLTRGSVACRNVERIHLSLLLFFNM